MCKMLLLHHITLNEHTLGRTPVDEESSRRKDVHLTTNNNQKTQDLCPRGIRTCDPSKGTVTDPLLRPRGHWDPLFKTSGT